MRDFFGIKVKRKQSTDTLNNKTLHVVSISENEFIGFILTYDKEKKPMVYLNTDINSRDIVEKYFEENFPNKEIETKIPEYLYSWAEKIKQIRKYGLDQDTSMIPLDLSDYTPKQRRVIETAHLKIPEGEYYSYGQVAEMADLIGAHRFVGTTMKKSRTPWVIPCQRVKSASWIKKYKRDMKRGSLL